MTAWPGTPLSQMQGTGPYKPDAPAVPASGGGVSPIADQQAPPSPEQPQQPAEAFPGEQVNKTTQYNYIGADNGQVEGMAPGYVWQADATRDHAVRGFRQRINQGWGAAALTKYLADSGISIDNPQFMASVQGAVNFKKKNPSFDLTSGDFDGLFANLYQVPVKVDPVTKGISGAFDTAPGAFAAGLGNQLLAGTEDELVGASGGNAEQAQAAKEYLRAEHPIAYPLGQMAGFVGQSLGASKLLGLGTKGTLAADAAIAGAHGAGENNDNRVGGALLEAGAATAGGLAGNKIASAIASRAPSKAALSMEQALNQGIDLPMGASSRAAAGIEKGLDVLPITANTMQAARDKLGGQVDNALENVAGAYGAAKTPQGMGSAAQEAARGWVSKFDKVSTKLYDAIPINGASPAQFSNTRQYLEGVVDQFSSNPALQAALRDSKMSAYFDALSSRGAQLSWQDLKAFRTRVGEKIGVRQFGEDQSEKAFRGLYGALSEDMRATAAARGPAALRAFERANNTHAAGMQRIDNALVTILGKDGMLSPEAAGVKLQQMAREGRGSADLRKLAEIRKSMPADEWGDVASAMIRLGGRPANSAGRDFDPSVFVRNYRDWPDAVKNLLFTDRGRGSLRESLDQFANVMDGLAKNNALRNTSNTAVVSTGVGTLAGGMTVLMNPALWAPVAGAGVGAFSLGKLWTNPRFVQWATGYARMVRNQAAQGAGQPIPIGKLGKQIELLGKVGASQPAITGEVIQLQNYLRSAFSESPMRAAAEGQQEENGGQVPPDQQEEDDGLRDAPQPTTPGNIDIHSRPVVRNPDGSISTVRTISIGTDQGEVLIPTVSDDGRIMTDEQAIDQYNRSGRHLGVFRSPQEATAFARALHAQQERQYAR